MKHQHLAAVPAGAAGLTATELARYRELRYIGPFPLFTDRQIDDVLREWDRTRDVLPWYKGHHAYRGPIVDALRSDAVAGQVASILGDDVPLWGMAPSRGLTTRRKIACHAPRRAGTHRPLT